MLGEETVLVDRSEDVSLREDITFLYFSWLELPKLGGVEGWDVNSFWYEDGL